MVAVVRGAKGECEAERVIASVPEEERVIRQVQASYCYCARGRVFESEGKCSGVRAIVGDAEVCRIVSRCQEVATTLIYLHSCSSRSSEADGEPNQSRRMRIVSNVIYARVPSASAPGASPSALSIPRGAGIAPDPGDRRPGRGGHASFLFLDSC